MHIAHLKSFAAQQYYERIARARFIVNDQNFRRHPHVPNSFSLMCLSSETRGMAHGRLSLFIKHRDGKQRKSRPGMENLLREETMQSVQSHATTADGSIIGAIYKLDANYLAREVQ